MCSLEGKKKTNCEAKSSNMHDYDREKIYSTLNESWMKILLPN